MKCPKCKMHGLFLGQDGNNFYYFGVSSSGYGRITLIDNKKIQNIVAPKGGFIEQKKSIIKHTLEIDNEQFSYSIDDQLVGNGSFIKTPGFQSNNFGIAVSCPQKVAFEDITIYSEEP